MSVSPAAGTVLCQPVPAPMTVIANYAVVPRASPEAPPQVRRTVARQLHLSHPAMFEEAGQTVGSVVLRHKLADGGMGACGPASTSRSAATWP